MRLTSKVFLFGLLVAAGLTTIFSLTSIATSNRAVTEPVQVAMRPFPHRHQPACQAADRIGAVGIVEPAGGIVEVGSESKGVVRKVFVEAGSLVRKGAPLFRLDGRAILAKLRFRESEFALAQARLLARQAERDELEQDTRVARAALDGARAELADAKQLVEMATRLKAASIISVRERMKRQFQMTRASARERQAVARLAKVLARSDALDPRGDGRTVAVDIAEVTKAKAAVDLDRTDMEKLTIRAPSDGTILQVNTRPGEVVEPESEPLILMGSQSQVHVRVDIDETDIVRYSPKQPARARRRGQQSQNLALEFVRLEPIVVPKHNLANRVGERVDSRVLKVLYRVKGAELLPGELLDVFIGRQCSGTDGGKSALVQQ